jgi:SAM-dependent methyltransferase
MTGRRPLTEIAQQAWAPYLRPGSWAVDATAGNGQDTEFLARAAGPAGRVFAVDIQQAALDQTRRRLAAAGLLDRITLVHGDHARLRDLLACGARGRVDLVCFNLGYLPGGDHALTTSPATTLPALLEALLLLGDRGALSVIAYRGHAGAMAEAEAVERFFASLPAPWRCTAHLATGSGTNPGPVWWLAAQAGPVTTSGGLALDG